MISPEELEIYARANEIQTSTTQIISKLIFPKETVARIEIPRLKSCEKVLEIIRTKWRTDETEIGLLNTTARELTIDLQRFILYRQRLANLQPSYLKRKNSSIYINLTEHQVARKHDCLLGDLFKKLPKRDLQDFLALVYIAQETITMFGRCEERYLLSVTFETTNVFRKLVHERLQSLARTILVPYLIGKDGWDEVQKLEFALINYRQIRTYRLSHIFRL